MKALDVTATLDLALAASGLDQMTVVHRPRLLSDNGSFYVASDLADWLRSESKEISAASTSSEHSGSTSYFGRAEAVLLERERIKRQAIANRRLQHQLRAA